MSSRIVLALLCLPLVFGCRDLVQSGEAPTASRRVEGLILAPDGSPLAGTDLEVTNERYVRPTNTVRIRWTGTTDPLGRFLAEVSGQGPFDVRIFPESSTGFPGFRFLRLWFAADEPVVLRLPLEAAGGRVGWAGEAPPIHLQTLRLFFFYQEEDWVHRLELAVTAAGDLQGWLAPNQLYRITADLTTPMPRLTYEWPDLRFLASGETLDLRVPVVGYDVDAMLGGLPALASSIRVWTTSEETSNQVVLLQETGAGPFRAYGFAELSSVDIEPMTGAPFLLHRFYLDLREPGATLVANLGLHRLTVGVMDGAGAPYAGARVRFDPGFTGGQSLTTGVDGRAGIFLDPGSYLVEVARPNNLTTYEKSVVVQVNSDREIVLTLD